MVHVPLVWTRSIVYGLMTDGCSLSDMERMDFFKTWSWTFMGDLAGIFFQ